MTYNLTLNALDRSKTVFDESINYPDMIVVIETSNPHMTAYKIREAYQAARHHKIEPYASLFFIVRAISEQGVVEVMQRPDASLDIYLSAPPENVFPDIKDAFGVVEFFHGGTTTASTFPNFNQDDLWSIQQWAEGRGYEIVSITPLTIRKEI